MASIRRRNGRWQAQVRREGFTPSSRTFSAREDALKWAEKKERDIELDVETTPLSVVLADYRDTVIPTKKVAETETYMINAIIRLPLSSISMGAITPSDISSYRDKRLTEVSPSTVTRELSLMSQAIDMAISERGLRIASNPCTPVKRPGQSRHRERRLQPGEEELILSSVSCRTPYMTGTILLALETAMRMGEILNVREADVNLSERMLFIRASKNGQTRFVPLSEKAVETLTKIHELNERPVSKQDLRSLRGFCKTSKANTERHVIPTTASSVKQAWRRLCKRAGIEGLHFHDLRHEAISHMVEKGLTLPEVTAIAGHRDPRMLMRYAHPDVSKVLPKLD